MIVRELGERGSSSSSEESRVLACAIFFLDFFLSKLVRSWRRAICREMTGISRHAYANLNKHTRMRSHTHTHTHTHTRARAHRRTYTYALLHKHTRTHAHTHTHTHFNSLTRSLDPPQLLSADPADQRPVFYDGCHRALIQICDPRRCLSSTDCHSSNQLRCLEKINETQSMYDKPLNSCHFLQCMKCSQRDRVKCNSQNLTLTAAWLEY